MYSTLFAVIDDENPTVYTAGAIVTVTVTLVRQNMNVLFGDNSVSDKHEQQDASGFTKGDQEEEDDKREELVNVAFIQLCVLIMCKYHLICPFFLRNTLVILMFFCDFIRQLLFSPAI
jgi:hypothetical protein